MLDLDTGRSVILRELDATIARLDAASDADWDRPVRCAGWTVRDLAKHITLGPRIMGGSIGRMIEGNAEPAAPDIPTLPDDRAGIMQAIRDGRAYVAPILQSLLPEHLMNMCPFPFATVPGFLSISILAFEVGVHRNDLEWALSNTEPMPAEIVDAASVVASGLLPQLAHAATEKPAAAIGYTLRGDELTLTFLYGDNGWESASDENAPTCEIRADDSSLLLFAFGRIPATHPNLTVSGAAELAPSFKTYFPGP